MKIRLLLLSCILCLLFTVPVHAADKVCYLTFDDGPSRVTAGILEMLAEKGVRATFFVTHENPEYAGLITRIYDEGHAVGLHAYKHEWSIYNSMASFRKDFEAIAALVEEKTGEPSRLYRFPGGSNCFAIKNNMKPQLREYIASKGCVIFDWNAVSGDDTKTLHAPAVLAGRVLRHAEGKDTVVALFHDTPICTNTAAAAAIVIDRLRAQGFRFEALTPGSPTAFW
jgi:peptidoglycan/xylan/chitin deacetylase (PgdA/CDA1 family)